MLFDGARSLPDRRGKVWLVLNDPEALKACMPGCEKLVDRGDGTYEAEFVAAVGPVKSRMVGLMSMKDVVMNERYTLEFDFQGGIAGFGKGALQVRLEDEPGGCRLHYGAETRVGGRIAQLGSRLIEGAAKKLSDVFFERLSAHVAARAAAEAAT